MIRPARRAVAFAAALLALSPALVKGAPAPAAQGPNPAPTFKPPTGRFILTSTIWRSLPGGKQIMVRRSYAIAIAATREGYRADGRIVAIKVDVPPKLEPIAAVERERWIDDPFPIALDRDGHTLSVTTRPAEAVALAKAAEASIRVLEQSHLDPAELRRREAFVRGVARTGTGNLWPKDLFNPIQDHTETQRTLTLPDGRTGEVTTVTAVRDRFDGGVPGTFERVVTTRLNGVESVSRETWTIAPESGPD